MDEMADLSVVMVETNLSDLTIGEKRYGDASTILKENSLEILYECRTSVLTEFQRELYGTITPKARDLTIFLDPIIISFALRDACDISGLDYVWLDLDGEEEIGCSAWVKGEDREVVRSLMHRLLKRHLDKYIIDAYDRRTRENMTRIWEAELKFHECAICGEASLDRQQIPSQNHHLRGWVCSNCGHHIILPTDILEHIEETRIENNQ